MQEGTFDIGCFNIKFDYWNRVLNIVPVYDIHYEDDNFASEEWKKFCAWGRKKTNNYYFLGGDYISVLSRRERLAYDQTDFHDDTRTLIESSVFERMMRLISDISFMKDRCIGVIDGNHDFIFKKTRPYIGWNVGEVIAHHLNTKHYGSMAWIRIRLKYSKGGSSISCDLMAVHGKTAPRLYGSSLNQVINLKDIIPLVNIYVAGHDHKKIAASRRYPKLVDAKGSVKMEVVKSTYVRAGTFLGAYNPGKASYAIQGLYSMTDIGVTKIMLRPERITKSEKGKLVSEQYRLDIHTSI